jgi:hypothetical protein
MCAVIALAHAHLDFGGTAWLFGVVGLVGLAVLAIYNKGKRDAGSPSDVDDSTAT